MKYLEIETLVESFIQNPICHSFDTLAEENFVSEETLVVSLLNIRHLAPYFNSGVHCF